MSKNITKDLGLRRARFNEASAFYGEHGITPQRTKLRAMAELVTGGDKLKFSFTKDNSLNAPLELLLDKSDLFVTTAIGLALVIEKDGEAGMAPLLSYPLQAGLHLPTGLAGFSNLNALAIYNGKLQMRTGSSVNYSRLSLDEFLYIPETQPTAVLKAADGTVVSSGILPAFNIQNVMDQMEESIVFAGTKNQPIELTFPLKAGSDFGIPAGHKAYAVLIFDGFIYEGGAAVTMKDPIKGIKNPYALNF